MRRSFRAALALLVLSALGMPALAQVGDAPVRVVLPFAPGGAGDALARIVAEAIRGATGRTAIAENRAGASGRIGVQYVRGSAPDGSVLLITPIAPMAIYPHTYDRLDYDPVVDFQPVSQVATFEFGLATGTATTATTMMALVDWVRANPARASYAIPGEGTLPHFCGVLFARTANLALEAIAYKGNVPAIADLMGGHVPMLFTSTPDLVVAHRAGRIRVLATSGEGRSPMLPDVPTFREAGYPITGVGWYAVYAPARTPPDTVERLSRIIADAVRAPAVRERFETLGLIPTGTTGPELAMIQKEASDLWGPVVRASRFKAEQ